MEEKKAAAEAAAAEYVKKNKIILECLHDPQKRLHLNASMASTIRQEVYAHSLARRLLVADIVKPGHCPAFAESEDGPVVLVNLVEKEQRVLKCRAFRDSLREEESVTRVRDIDFVVMRGQAVRPASFSLSNVCTLRWPELNGNSYSMVERARQRLKVILAKDETTVVLRAIAWVCDRFGWLRWARSGKRLGEVIRRSIDAVGGDRNPVILCSIHMLKDLINNRLIRAGNVDPMDPVGPVVFFRYEERDYPIYPSESIPAGRLYVIPSGESLGTMPIFVEPNVIDYDKTERLIKGWLCYQDQGMVFVNVKITNTIFVGYGGLLELLKTKAARFF